MILIHDIPLASTIPAQQTVDRVLSFKVPTLDHWNHPRDTRDTADWLAVNICKHIWNEFKHLQTMFYHVFIVVFFVFSCFTIVSASMDHPFLFYCVFSLPSATWVTWFPGSHQLSGWQPRRPGLDSSNGNGNGEFEERFWMDKQNPNRSQIETIYPKHKSPNHSFKMFQECTKKENQHRLKSN